MKLQNLIASSLTALLLLGCATGSGGTRQYVPIINASLAGGKGVAEAGKSFATDAENVGACYTTSAFITAIDAASQIIDAWDTTDGQVVVLPEVIVDIGTCHALLGEEVTPVFDEKTKRQVETIANIVTPALVNVIKSVVLSADDIKCKDQLLASAILDYFEGVVPAVVEELGAPDGHLFVPSVQITLSECE